MFLQLKRVKVCEVKSDQICFTEYLCLYIIINAQKNILKNMKKFRCYYNAEIKFHYRMSNVAMTLN